MQNFVSYTTSNGLVLKKVKLYPKILVYYYFLTGRTSHPRSKEKFLLVVLEMNQHPSSKKKKP